MKIRQFLHGHPDLLLRWVQLLIGTFFLSAAFYKFTGYFWNGDQSFTAHFHFWVSRDIPLELYETFILFILSLPYGEFFLEVSTVVLLGLVGVFLIVNRNVLIAGWMLLFIQLNIFFATYYDLALANFVGFSLWIALYFSFPQRVHGKLWPFYTGFLALLIISQMVINFLVGEPWPSWVTQSLLSSIKADVMSISPFLKTLLIQFLETSFGPTLWAGLWWLHIPMVALLITRFRWYGVAVIATLMFMRAILFTNTVATVYSLATITLLLWLAQEEIFGRKAAKR